MSPPALITTFSVDNSAYLAWQAELLEYTFRRSEMYGDLVRLRSGSPPATVDRYQGETFDTESFVNQDGLYYPPFNKPGSLLAWSKGELADETPVLIVDPDCIFVRPIDEEIVRSVGSGTPVGHPVAGWLNPYSPAWAPFVKRHCSASPADIDQVGVPLIVTRSDLARIAPLWWRKILEIKQDTIPNGVNDHAKDRGGWEAEMWAYVFACAELGISHSSVELCRFQMDDRTDLPIIHYAYDSKSPSSSPRWEWKKATYKPWDQVEIPPDVPAATELLLEDLNACAASKVGYGSLTWNMLSTTGLIRVLSR